MTSIEARPATSDDLPRMAAMAAQLVRLHHARDPGRFMLPDNVESGYLWWLGNELGRDGTELWVATVDAAIAGYSYATMEERDWNALLDPHGAIHDIWVEVEHRKHGIGAKLLGSIVAALEARGATRIVLSTMVSNEAAQALFRAHGFRSTMLEMTRGG